MNPTELLRTGGNSPTFCLICFYKFAATKQQTGLRPFLRILSLQLTPRLPAVQHSSYPVLMSQHCDRAYLEQHLVRADLRKQLPTANLYLKLRPRRSSPQTCMSVHSDAKFNT